jgi:hypothetical protein
VSTSTSPLVIHPHLSHALVSHSVWPAVQVYLVNLNSIEYRTSSIEPRTSYLEPRTSNLESSSDKPTQKQAPTLVNYTSKPHATAKANHPNANANATMATPSPTASHSPSSAPPEPDQDAAALPMTLSASVLLDHLPKDATAALETAGELGIAKGKCSAAPPKKCVRRKSL